MADDKKVIFSMVGVTKTYPPQKTVLKDIYLSFFYGAKIGIIGLNGAGKSTLLKIIAGIDKSYQGNVVFSPGYSVGYLEQEPKLDPDKTVIEVVREGVQPVMDMLAEFDKVNEAFADPDADFDTLLARQAELQDKLDAADAWNIDSKLERAMDADFSHRPQDLIPLQAACATGGADVVIATPGRFISHISLGNVDLSKVSFFILDEADRMLDMGFSEDIMTIAKHLPPTCQTIMFSATMPKKIEDLAKTLLHDPVEVKLAVSKPAEKIHQMAYVCHETQKLGIIKHLFKDNNLKRVIIFCGSKMKVKQVAGALQRMKINCGEMHSDLEQAERDDMMFKFKSGQYDVIVATDIIARGIDIDDIQMVVNYDVPHDAEDYVHRIGRTARAERDGSAITLVSDDDMVYFNQIEKFLEKEVEKLPLPEGLGEAPEYRKSSFNSRQALFV